MSMFRRMLRSLAVAVIVAGTVIGSATDALADKVKLKDGRTLEGAIVRETDAFIQIKIKIGGIETTQIIQKSEIASIEKDAAAEPAPAPAAGGESGSSSPAPAPETPAADKDKAGGKAAERAKTLDSSATRVALLNFGPPSTWKEQIESTVGVQINASAWRAAVPLLEKDKVQVVIVRINSGGGALSEMAPFQDLFEQVYKRKFRTVAWVESAISCAAMSPYPIEEFYFMPRGNLGACTAWSGALQNMEGIGLEALLARMEVVSTWGKRSPAIMRSMQIQEPLSASIDPVTGEVTWFQDTSGEKLLNPPNQILTLTASDAVKFGFAKGIAATKEDLVELMGLKEVVWAGEEAARLIDDNMRASDRMEKRWEVSYRDYELNLAYAEQAPDQADRGKFGGRALKALRELRQLFSANKNFARQYRIDDNWFRDREEEIKKLMADRR